MTQNTKRFAVILGALCSIILGGCPSDGIGDPCSPEAVPQNDDFSIGFNSKDVFLETSSVQCRTRVCMAYKLEGHPDFATDSGSCETGKATTDKAASASEAFQAPVNVNKCPTNANVTDRVYCTCRCGGQGSTPLCECPDGFECTEILKSGGDGLRGSYCVKANDTNGDRIIVDTAR